MNMHPIYRRRRRVAFAIIVTIAGAVLWVTGPDGTDGNDPCDLTPKTPTCELSK